MSAYFFKINCKDDIVSRIAILFLYNKIITFVLPSIISLNSLTYLPSGEP